MYVSVGFLCTIKICEVAAFVLVLLHSHEYKASNTWVECCTVGEERENFLLFDALQCNRKSSEGLNMDVNKLGFILSASLRSS